VIKIINVLLFVSFGLLTACGEGSGNQSGDASSVVVPKPVVKVVPLTANERVKQKIIANFSGATANRVAQCNLAGTVMARIMSSQYRQGRISERMLDAQMTFLEAWNEMRENSPEANKIYFNVYGQMPYGMTELSSGEKLQYSKTNSSCIREASSR